MHVNILNLQKLFAAPVRYEIPPFQRPYVWTQEQQWGPLWEDVANTADEQLVDVGGIVPTKGSSAHFLGAIVLQQQNVPAPMLMTRLVVDGQQRLTTLQLLLDAVQEVFEQRRYDSASERLALLVLNQEAFRGDNPDHAFKVWPTMGDQEAFRYTMRNDLPSAEYEDSVIVQAHEFFKLQVDQWLGTTSEMAEQKAAALERVVTNLLELVVIDLDHSDDPHVIFETLNARGTPLLQSDLVRNMVLHEVSKAGLAVDQEEASRLWSFQDEWWRVQIQQGRLARPRIDVFLNYWVTMRKQDDVVAKDVFSEFRNYYACDNTPIEMIAADIRRVGETYRALEQASIPGIGDFLYRREVMQAGVLTPVLLWLLTSEVPQDQLYRCLLALESHQVRRMACRKTTMGANRLFISLVEALEKAGPKFSGDTVVGYLRNQESAVGEWPSDTDLENAFINLPLYRLLTRGRLRLVLEGIEVGLRSDKAETQSVPHNLSIEHIMPQQWRQHWSLPRGEDDTTLEDRGRKRDGIIHSIGNLTLVHQKLQHLFPMILGRTNARRSTNMQSYSSTKL